jgi:hypothetical protein
MKHLSFIAIITVLLISCSKENSDVFVPYPDNPLNDTTWVEQIATTASVNKLPEILSITSNTDSIEATVTTKIHYSEFLDITFPAAFAKLPNGEQVSGKIKVEVIHLRKKGDFIRFARPTTSYGRLLESGGAFYIKVTKNGQELVMNSGKTITLHIRDANAVSNLMKVFYGVNPTGNLPTGTNPAFTWVQAADTGSIVNVVTRQDSTGIYKGYELTSKGFSWVNCDYFIDSLQAKTRINAILPANFTNTNTSVFAVFKEQKIVVQLNPEVSSHSFFAPNIPTGKKVTVISISKIGDDLFSASKDVTIESNMRISLNPERRTKAQLDQILDAL